MDPSERRLGFLRFETSWLFVGYLLASSDLIIRLRDLQFISTIDWVQFVSTVYGLYLALTLIIGNIIYIFLNASCRRLLSKEMIQKAAIIVFVTFVVWMILVKATPIQLATGGLINTLGLVSFLIAGGTIAFLLSTIIFLFIRRHIGAVFGACLILFICAYLVAPIWRPAAGPHSGRAETATDNPI